MTSSSEIVDGHEVHSTQGFCKFSPACQRTSYRGPVLASFTRCSGMISIIIPALNEAGTIQNTLEVLRSRPSDSYEIILVDGNSSDDTVLKAAPYCDKVVITGRRSRQFQMNLGARVASGSVLLFLHADTRLPAQALPAITQALQDSRVIGGGGRIRFVPERPVYSILKRAREFVSSRTGIFGTAPFFFIRREVFTMLGGFRERVSEQGVDLSRRARRFGRLVQTEIEAQASARRFEKGFFLGIVLIWAFLVGLSLLGVEAAWLERYLYRTVR